MIDKTYSKIYTHILYNNIYKILYVSIKYVFMKCNSYICIFAGITLVIYFLILRICAYILLDESVFKQLC